MHGARVPPILAPAALVPGREFYAQPSPLRTNPMSVQQPQSPQVPPDILRYIKGPASEAKQFDFLIGEWDVEATRYNEDGSPLLNYKALWSATHLNEGRMVMDDFKALGPNGQPVSSFVTLRTYSEATNRWEIVGLQACQPALPTEWHGAFKDGEYAARRDCQGTEW